MLVMFINVVFCWPHYLNVLAALALCIVIKRIQKLVMEVNPITLGFIGLQNENPLTTVPDNPSAFQTPEFTAFEKEKNIQTRKLRLQYEQLMRKKTLKKKIEEREKGAQQRLLEIKNRNQLNMTLNQKALSPFLEEKEYKSPKNIRNSLQNKCIDQKLTFRKKEEAQKQNSFKVYHKEGKMGGLPKITKQRVVTKQIINKFKTQEVDLVGFGIFSTKKELNTFLKKLKTNLEKEFVGPVNLQSEQEVQKMEGMILSEVVSERRWLLFQQ